MNFKDLLEEHQQRVRNGLNDVILDFVKRSQEHDMDKLLDERVASVYEEHFTTLKTFVLGLVESCPPFKLNTPFCVVLLMINEFLISGED